MPCLAGRIDLTERLKETFSTDAQTLVQRFHLMIRRSENDSHAIAKVLKLRQRQ